MCRTTSRRDGHHLNWLILIVVLVGGAGVRHFMNIRYHGGGKELVTSRGSRRRSSMGGGRDRRPDGDHANSSPQGPEVTGPVTFARAQEIMVHRCMVCHSSHPTDDTFKVAPNGIMFDVPENVVQLKDRIYGPRGAPAHDATGQQDKNDRHGTGRARRLDQARREVGVGALLVVAPLAERYLSLVRGFFQLDHKKVPVLIPIESAGAIAQAERAFESFDVPKGTLRGAPPVPEDDLTTLRTSLYLVAHKKLGADLVTSLTQAIMSARRNLMREQPVFAQITAPSTEQDAYLPLHPGAAAVYNATTQSFMDEYGNWIYLTPMVLGGAATMLAAAWKFLRLGSRATEGPLDSLYALSRRIRKADSEAELSDIEDEIDNILKAERAKSAGGDESAVDDATLNVAAHRLESLIHDRRTLLAKKPAVASAA